MLVYFDSLRRKYCYVWDRDDYTVERINSSDVKNALYSGLDLICCTNVHFNNTYFCNGLAIQILGTGNIIICDKNNRGYRIKVELTQGFDILVSINNHKFYRFNIGIISRWYTCFTPEGVVIIAFNIKDCDNSVLIPYSDIFSIGYEDLSYAQMLKEVVLKC